MGTHTRAQHHIGLRLEVDISSMGTHTPTSHWVEEVEVDNSSMGTHTPTSHWVEANVDNSSMWTLTRAQHHIGLRLMLTIALWGHSLEPNITLG